MPKTREAEHRWEIGVKEARLSSRWAAGRWEEPRGCPGVSEARKGWWAGVPP